MTSHLPAEAESGAQQPRVWNSTQTPAEPVDSAQSIHRLGQEQRSVQHASPKHVARCSGLLTAPTSDERQEPPGPDDEPTAVGTGLPLREKRGFVTPTETNLHGGALCFMVQTGKRHKTTEALLNNGWQRLAVGGGWRLAAAVGGWRLVVGGWWSLGAVLNKNQKRFQGQPWVGSSWCFMNTNGHELPAVRSQLPPVRP